jgi:predicted enzyme related to lactoylglutathione lyase
MTALSMTKLVVGDLEAAIAFYGAVCGLSPAQRIEGAVEGRQITEVIMGSAAPTAPTLVLFSYEGVPAPQPGECMLVFDTDDLEAFVVRAVAAGGSIMQPPQALPDFGLSFAFVRDPEGHIVEALQRSRAAEALGAAERAPAA